MSISQTSHDVMPLPLAMNAALALLDRQQQRRRQRVPTLSVIAGYTDTVDHLVCRWAERDRRPVCRPLFRGLADALSCWFDALAKSRSLTAVAWTWLANRADQDAHALACGLPARSLEERTLFLDRLLGANSAAPADAVCRAIIEHACLDGIIAKLSWHRLENACRGDAILAAAGVLALIGDERAPLLHVGQAFQPDGSFQHVGQAFQPDAWSTGSTCQARKPDLQITSAAHDLVKLRSLFSEVVSLVSALPALPMIVSAGPELIAEYLVATSECHALALVREGLVHLVEPTAPAPTQYTAGLAPAVLQPRIADGAHAQDISTESETLTPDAPPAIERPGRDASLNDDDARSAAERYLFERLQAHPATAGLFELNGMLNVAGRGRALEVDLLARKTRVAVEIDGYYHFTDQDAYRRDREKDVLLQLAGYVVVRCLADDVASRLEEILQTIVAAMRRSPPR